MIRPQLRANWGHGRLRPLESLANFSVAFCKLNGTSILEFAKFMKSYLDIPAWPPASLDAAAARKLCVLLDEPEDVIDSVIPPFAWQSSHPVLNALQESASHDRDLHFCSECLVHGYHSALHDVCWLMFCPIHRIRLSRAPVAVLGGSRFHRYCNALRTCLCNAKTGWPQSAADGNVGCYALNSRLIEIRDWVARSRNRLAALGEVIWVADQFGGGVDVGTALGVMEALEPPPTYLGEVVVPHLTLQLTIDHFEPSTLSPIRRAGLTIDETNWLYRLTNLDFRRREIAPRLQHLNGWIARAHRTCKCAWSWSRYSGWSPLRDGDAPPFGGVCPYEKISQELCHAWQCDRNHEGGILPLNKDSWFQLDRIAKKLAEHALVNKMKRNRGGYTLEWKLPPKLEALLNVLNAFHAELELRQELAWLARLEEGYPPWDAPSLGEGALLSATSEDLFFTRWLPISAVS